MFVCVCGFETDGDRKPREMKTWSLFGYSFKLFTHWYEQTVKLYFFKTSGLPTALSKQHILRARRESLKMLGGAHPMHGKVVIHQHRALYDAENRIPENRAPYLDGR